MQLQRIALIALIRLFCTSLRSVTVSAAREEVPSWENFKIQNQLARTLSGHSAVVIS